MNPFTRHVAEPRPMFAGDPIAVEFPDKTPEGARYRAALLLEHRIMNPHPKGEAAEEAERLVILKVIHGGRPSPMDRATIAFGFAELEVSPGPSLLDLARAYDPQMTDPAEFHAWAAKMVRAGMEAHYLTEAAQQDWRRQPVRLAERANQLRLAAEELAAEEAILQRIKEAEAAWEAEGAA